MLYSTRRIHRPLGSYPFLPCAIPVKCASTLVSIRVSRAIIPVFPPFLRLLPSLSLHLGSAPELRQCCSFEKSCCCADVGLYKPDDRIRERRQPFTRIRRRQTATMPYFQTLQDRRLSRQDADIPAFARRTLGDEELCVVRADLRSWPGMSAAVKCRHHTTGRTGLKFEETDTLPPVAGCGSYRHLEVPVFSRIQYLPVGTWVSTCLGIQ